MTPAGLQALWDRLASGPCGRRMQSGRLLATRTVWLRELADVPDEAGEDIAVEWEAKGRQTPPSPRQAVDLWRKRKAQSTGDKQNAHTVGCHLCQPTGHEARHGRAPGILAAVWLDGSTLVEGAARCPCHPGYDRWMHGWLRRSDALWAELARCEDAIAGTDALAQGRRRDMTRMRAVAERVLGIARARAQEVRA